MNIVSNFLKRVADENFYTTVSCVFGDYSSYFTQSTGSVYGLFVDKDLYDKCDSTKSSNGKTVISSKWFPLYWGKDVTPPSRIQAHFRKSSSSNGTGSIYQDLKPLIDKKLKIIYGCVWVEKYEDFEKFLYQIYPPLFGGNTKGKSNRKTTILF